MLKLDPLFADYCVLQREKEVQVWGIGNEGSAVHVTIQGHHTVACVQNGKWAATLPKLAASDSEEMTVTDGTDTVVLKNVAVGEVWIAGGQSNMEFPMRILREYRSVNITSIPQIRLYGVPRISYDGQLEDDDFSEYRIWRPCTPENFWFYSAIPFYFSVRLYEKYHVPVGILNCNVGGTQASSWAEQSILEKTGARVWIDDYNERIKGLDVEKYIAGFKANPMNKTKSQDHSAFHDKMWKGYSGFEMFFLKPKFKRMFSKMPPFGPLDRNRPFTLYEHMVKTIAPYGARGVIWYQGESDDPHADVYDEAMGAVIDSWRSLWKDNLPFLMVQLAPYEGFMGFPAMNYVTLREKQEKLSKTKENVYITNAMDAGMRHDIHPKQKKPVAERLALLARGKVYHEDILCEAPEVSWYRQEGSRIIITFTHCGAGLGKYKGDIDALDVTANGRSVTSCTAHVDKDSLVIESSAFRDCHDITVKYGKRNYCQCNIKNSAGIPIKPFELVIGTER